MTYARKLLVSLEDTPYYHVVARCVRRAWLWGVDEYAGRDYSHRKRWVIERLRQLSEVFAIDLCAYAVMSNHYHLVVYVDRARARRLTREEVVERWTRLFAAPPWLARWRDGQLSVAECEIVDRHIERWRGRLMDLSWFMKCMNEHLARRANAEDGCTGRFWEGRFRSQALLDEAGLLTAMAYVDLNPVRAKVAATPESSEYTSIHARIRQQREGTARAVPLRRFGASASGEDELPCRYEEYLTLVDWSGRQAREGKRGHIDEGLPPILERLRINVQAWVATMRPRGNLFGRALGSLGRLRMHAINLDQSWVRGLGQARRLYAS